MWPQVILSSTRFEVVFSSFVSTESRVLYELVLKWFSAVKVEVQVGWFSEVNAQLDLSQHQTFFIAISSSRKIRI